MLFELVGIFEEGIGPDRISDMIARIIGIDLLLFTTRICEELKIPTKFFAIDALKAKANLPINPLTGKHLILVPREILRDLPIATSYADIRMVSEFNATLRAEFNDGIGLALSGMTLAQRKEKLRRDFIRFPKVLSDIIRAYEAEVPDKYDFSDDPSGEVIWYRASKDVVAASPLGLHLPVNPIVDDVMFVVLKICDHFKKLIEENQLGQLLYNKDGKAKHESAAQLLFFGVASAYCEANNLDLSPESDAGRGPVDFKVSLGFEAKILVELKLTSNKQLKHGFENQLPIYQRAENTTHGVYLVIDNGGATKSRLFDFQETVLQAGGKAPKVVMVDAVRRQSASKADD
ncbi:hypothetical protein D3C81_1290050 [compost metagenome]